MGRACPPCGGSGTITCPRCDGSEEIIGVLERKPPFILTEEKSTSSLLAAERKQQHSYKC